MNNPIRVGRILGIEIRLDLSWFIIFLLITWSLAGHYLMVYEGWTFTFRVGLSIVTALLFFSSVLAHELGHSLIAIHTGVPVKRITLFIFGGMAQIAREPKRALDEFIIAIAGPVTSLLLAAGFGLMWLMSQWLEIRSLTALAAWLGGINLSLALFNMIPGFPLDGGRVLRSIVWGITDDLHKATRFGAKLGQVISLAFIFTGIWQILADNWISGMWIALIGWFLNSVATNSLHQIEVQDILKGYTVRDVMMTDCPRLSSDLRLQQLVDGYILCAGQRCFPVTEGEQIIGLVSVQQVKEIPQAKWPTTTVEQIMIQVEKFISTQPEDDLVAVLERMIAGDVNLLPVMETGRLVGLVARDNILRFINTLSKLRA